MGHNGGGRKKREEQRLKERGKETVSGEGEEVMYLSLAFTPYQVCMPLSECVL